jgi:hypothetical protein
MSGDITERIEALLWELEQLSHGAKEMPLPLLIQTLSVLGETRRVLKNCPERKARAATEAKSDGEGEGDPQPDVDSEMMERMYRSLGTGRPLPKR